MKTPCLELMAMFIVGCSSVAPKDVKHLPTDRATLKTKTQKDTPSDCSSEAVQALSVGTLRTGQDKSSLPASCVPLSATSYECVVLVSDGLFRHNPDAVPGSLVPIARQPTNRRTVQIMTGENGKIRRMILEFHAAEAYEVTRRLHMCLGYPEMEFFCSKSADDTASRCAHYGEASGGPFDSINKDWRFGDHGIVLAAFPDRARVIVY